MNMKKIRLGDYISLITDYHSGGSYQTLKEKTKILHKPDYAVYVRTINFESNNFDSDLVYCDESSYKFLEYSHVKENDILINKIANPGSVYLMPKVSYKATCGLNLFLIRLNGISQRYMYYVMKYNESYIKSKAHGTSTKTITKDEVRDLSFYIHDEPEEQKKVEKTLNCIARKISLIRNINKELETMAKEIYGYWFIQFDFPNTNGTPYKSSGGKMIWNNELGQEIPNGWKVQKIRDYLFESDKSKIQVNQVNNSVGNIPFFTSGNAIHYINDYLVDNLNIFLSTGGNASVQIYFGKASYSTDTWCINFSEYTSYMFIFIQSIIGYINDNLFTGSGLKHLQKDKFGDIKIAIPPENVINAFNKTVVNLFKMKAANMKSSRILNEQMNELLPLLMNGQVSVKE